MFQEFLSRIFSFFKAWGDFRKKCKFFLAPLIRDTFLCSRTSVRTVYFKLHQSYCQQGLGAGAGCFWLLGAGAVFWPLGAGAAREKTTRSRSRLKKKQEPEPLKISRLPSPAVSHYVTFCQIYLTFQLSFFLFLQN